MKVSHNTQYSLLNTHYSLLITQYSLLNTHYSILFKMKTNDEEKCAKAILALYEVYDPEIGLNVVDLGLIYQIGFEEEGMKVETMMTLTSQFCPMGESITNDVVQALTKEFPDYQIEVNLTFDPPWSSDLISPEGRKFLDS